MKTLLFKNKFTNEILDNFDIPDFPFNKFVQNLCTPIPSDEQIPNPITTTRRPQIILYKN